MVFKHVGEEPRALRLWRWLLWPRLVWGSDEATQVHWLHGTWHSRALGRGLLPPVLPAGRSAHVPRVCLLRPRGLRNGSVISQEPPGQSEALAITNKLFFIKCVSFIYHPFAASLVPLPFQWISGVTEDDMIYFIKPFIFRVHV